MVFHGDGVPSAVGLAVGFLSNSLLGTPRQPHLFKVRILKKKEKKANSISIEILYTYTPKLTLLKRDAFCISSHFWVCVLFLIRITNSAFRGESLGRGSAGSRGD